jgi:hypothetical protein
MSKPISAPILAVTLALATAAALTTSGSKSNTIDSKIVQVSGFQAVTPAPVPNMAITLLCGTALLGGAFLRRR